MRRLFTAIAAPCVWQQMRLSSDAKPSVEEVRKAYGVLGAATSSDFKVVRARYLELAKQHHPDVSGKAGTDSMAAINDAYKTVDRYFKGGGRPPGAPQATSRHHTGAPFGTDGAHSFGGGADYHQSMYSDPLGWEQFFAWQNGQGLPPEPPFGWDADPSGAFYSHDFAGNAFGSTHDRQRPRNSDHSRGQEKKAHPKDTSGSQKEKEKDRDRKSGGMNKSKWTDAERDAMANMYREGQSFEFIANALGKTTQDVLDEYNFAAHAAQQQMGSSRQRRRFGPQDVFVHQDLHPEYVRMMENGEVPEGYDVFADEDGTYYTITEDGRAVPFTPEFVDFEDDDDFIPFDGRHQMHGSKGYHRGHDRYQGKPKRHEKQQGFTVHSRSIHSDPRRGDKKHRGGKRGRGDYTR